MGLDHGSAPSYVTMAGGGGASVSFTLKVDSSSPRVVRSGLPGFHFF